MRMGKEGRGRGTNPAFALNVYPFVLVWILLVFSLRSEQVCFLGLSTALCKIQSVFEMDLDPDVAPLQSIWKEDNWAIGSSLVDQYPHMVRGLFLLPEENEERHLLLICSGGLLSHCFIKPPRKIGTYVISHCLKTGKFCD